MTSAFFCDVTQLTADQRFEITSQKSELNLENHLRNNLLSTKQFIVYKTHRSSATNSGWLELSCENNTERVNTRVPRV